MVSVTTQIRPNPKVMYRTLDDEAVLLNVQSGLYYGINQVGARFWELVGEQGNMGAIYRAMLQEFDVTAEQLWQDLERLVEALRAEGLVEIDDSLDG